MFGMSRFNLSTFCYLSSGLQKELFYLILLWVIQQDQLMVMSGHLDSNLQKELDRYIPTAAALGGM
jgi:hypothetical protein